MASISVVIPCYNYGRFLGEAIDSVRRQTLRPLEVIVVDDGSTDDTRDIVARYGDVRYLHKANGRLSRARNDGAEACVGDAVLFLDADNALEPACLEKCARQFDREADD